MGRSKDKLGPDTLVGFSLISLHLKNYHKDLRNFVYVFENKNKHTCRLTWRKLILGLPALASCRGASSYPGCSVSYPAFCLRPGKATEDSLDLGPNIPVGGLKRLLTPCWGAAQLWK